MRSAREQRAEWIGRRLRSNDVSNAGELAMRRSVADWYVDVQLHVRQRAGHVRKARREFVRAHSVRVSVSLPRQWFGVHARCGR